MKKSIALLALAFGVTGAFAQDLTSKKGEPMLPEADDWSIGVDATPFLNYAGNFFGKQNNNTAPTWNFLNSNFVITGKMMKDAQTAYRASVRLGMNNTTTKMMNDDRAAAAPTATNTGYPNTAAQKENKWKSSQTNVNIAVGIEKRRGKTRLQGYYGAEVGFGIGMGSDKFTYGNALAVNQVAPSVDVNVTNADEFNGTINNVQNAAGLGIQGALLASDARMLSRKSGMTFSFGVRGFIGAEYFFMPKMSFGGEFGWGIGFSMQGQSKTSWESVGDVNTTTAADNSIGTTEIKGNKSSGFRFDTDNNNSLFGPAGALRLNFYF